MHFKTTADAINIPVILYNVPGRTGCNILPSTVVRLAKDCKNIVAIKEASGNISQVAKVAKVANFCKSSQHQWNKYLNILSYQRNHPSHGFHFLFLSVVILNNINIGTCRLELSVCRSVPSFLYICALEYHSSSS